MINCIVRPARPADVQAICTLMLSGSDESVGHEGTQDEVDNWRNSVANINVINRRMQEPNMKIIVAEGNAHHIPIGLLGTGYATVNEIGDAHIGGINVSVKNRQIEHRIMNELVKWLKASKANNVTMSISHANLSLKNLAEELGFTMQGVDSGAYFINGKFETWVASISDIKTTDFDTAYI